MPERPSRTGPIGVLSTGKMIVVSLFASSFVLVVSIAIQWVVYDDWLHRTGPLRIIGTVIAACLTFLYIFHWLAAERARNRDILLRFEKIAYMNDRIRNAMQAIECVSYVTDPSAARSVQQASDVIDAVLREILVDVGGHKSPDKSRTKETAA